MEFGDKSRFAIAIDLDREHGGAWLFGRICYWIGNAIVGRYDLGTSLRDVLFQITYILGDRGKRTCSALLHLEKEKLFSIILDALNEKNNNILQYTGQDFLPARFDVRIPVDVFDTWRVFLVEGDGAAKLLYRESEFSEVVETTLQFGEFDRVFERACIYLEHLYGEAVSSPVVKPA